MHLGAPPCHDGRAPTERLGAARLHADAGAGKHHAFQSGRAACHVQDVTWRCGRIGQGQVPKLEGARHVAHGHSADHQQQHGVTGTRAHEGEIAAADDAYVYPVVAGCQLVSASGCHGLHEGATSVYDLLGEACLQEQGAGHHNGRSGEHHGLQEVGAAFGPRAFAWPAPYRAEPASEGSSATHLAVSLGRQRFACVST